MDLQKKATNNYSVELTIKTAPNKQIRDCVVHMMNELGMKQSRIKSFTITKENKTAAPMVGMIFSIKKFYPNLKIYELKRAFDLALQGKFEVETSLYNKDFNFEYLTKIIKAYNQFMAPLRKKQQQSIDKIDDKSLISEDEKQKQVSEGIKKAYQSYKKTGIMPEVCSWMYIVLKNEGQINHSDDIQLQIDRESRETLKSLLEAKRKAINQNNVKEMTKRLQDIDNDPLLPGMKKKIGLKYYWDKLINIENL